MKQLILLLILGAIMAILSGCAAFAATPADSGQIEIALTDYDILPRVIRVKAGQEVTIVLKNEGDKLHELMIGRDIIVEDDFTEGFSEDFFAGITPEIKGPGMVMGMEGMEMEGMEGMEMEGMAGMDEHREENAMSEMDEHAMEDAETDEHAMKESEMAEAEHDEEMDMTESTMVEDDMEMAEEEHAMADDEMAEEGMEMEGMAGMDEHTEENEMSEMDEHTMAEGEMSQEEMAHEEDMAAEMDEMEHATAEDEHAEEDDHAMSEDEMAGMEHDDEEMGHNDMIATSFGALQRPSMDAHAGLMVMLDPAPMPSETVTTITFIVPEDKVGEWEMGCFQEQGQHYDDGMKGTLIVEPAS